MTTWIFGLSLSLVVALAAARRRRRAPVNVLPPPTISTLLVTRSRSQPRRADAALQAATAILR